MNFVELDRCFVRLAKDETPDLEIGRVWGSRYGSWLTWPDLLKYRRVVLLAEAECGKSEEFRNQARRLASEGKAGFYVRIEDLADQDLASAIDPEASVAFEAWLTEPAEAWFFLDSVDEARLNKKSFENALKRLRRALGRHLERAHVLISCRATDWKSADDPTAITSILPAWEVVDEAEGNDRDPDAGLLDPIFGDKSKSTVDSPNEEQVGQTSELLVVQLAPLSNEQCKTLARAAGVPDVSLFMQAVGNNGLDVLTERPSDVRDLASYWKTHSRFGPLVEMVEHSISRKLASVDQHRSDSAVLSAKEAREGAERLAAALTLGKSFTVRVPGPDVDVSLAPGALDPEVMLNEWTPAQIMALLRRGIFSPATCTASVIP